MGLLDRFNRFAAAAQADGTKATPAPDEPAPTQRRSPLGGSGRFNFHGILQLEELNVELQGVRGLRIFDLMYRTDPDIRRSMAMAYNPIIDGTWVMEPANGDKASDQDREVAEFTWWALTEAMRPNFTMHLMEALPLLMRSGFTPFEYWWTTTLYKGRQVLVPKKLDARLPRSIHQWFQDDEGDLTAISQLLLGKGLVSIPATSLVYYRLGPEGDNWEGTPLLRPAYKPWFMKDAIERLDAIGQERGAVGLPVVYPPSAEPSQEMLDDIEKRLQGLRGGEQGYLLMPGPKQGAGVDESKSWLIEILGQGSKEGRDPQPSLKYHSDKIAAVFMAEFIRLGQGGVGARATADVQQEPHEAAVRALATIIQDELNRQLVPAIARLNYPNIETTPKLVMSGENTASLGELGTYIQALAAAQAIHSDNPLEDYLRERADLPPADEEERKTRMELAARQSEAAATAAETRATAPNPAPGDAAPAPAGAKPKPKPTTTAAGVAQEVEHYGRQQRDLTWWEQLMSVDRLEQSIDGARAQLETAAGPTVRTAAAAIAANVGATKAGAVKLTVNDEHEGQLVDAIHQELGDLYDTGRQTVQEELDRQRPGAPRTTYAVPATDRPPSLLSRARLAAAAVMQSIIHAITQQHLTGRATPADLQLAGEQAGTAALRAQAQLHAAPAINDGRSDEFTAHADEIRGVHYTSLLDGNTCTPCRVADDGVLRKLTDPVRLARRPPNPDCNGGGRCRCMEFAVLHDEPPLTG